MSLRTEKVPILFGPLPPPYGGVSVFMNAIYPHAIEAGVEIWSYTGGVESRKYKDARYVDHRRLGHILKLLTTSRLASITDSSHFHIEYPNPLLVPLWLLVKRLRGFRWIKIVHDGSLPFRFDAMHPLRKKLFHAALAQVDELVVYSRDLERWFTETARYTGQIRFTSLLTPPPADWGNYHLSPDHRAALDRFARHPKRVCSIGVFIESYGFHNVTDAVEQLRKDTGQDIGLMLVDGAFARDEQYRAAVLKYRPWVVVVENVPHPGLGNIFAVTDIFVRAFAHESYGLSRVEAIWSNVPTIATDIGETRGMLTYKFADLPRLTEHLHNVLEGRYPEDLSHWANVYRQEAQQNLRQWLEVITEAADV